MKRLLLFSLVAAMLSFATLASAQGEDPDSDVAVTTAPTQSAHDIVWATRSLTPNRLQLQVLAGPTSRQALSILGANQEFGLNITHRPYGNYVALPLGFAFGVLDNLEVGIGLPIYLSPGGFGDLPIWATYQILEGAFQLGVQLAFYIPTDTDFALQIGAPMIYNTNNIRIDTGVFLHFNFMTRVVTELFAPLRVGFQIMDELYAGVQTELRATFYTGATYFDMPLYAFVAYTLASNLGPIDLGFRFGFPHVIQAGPRIDRVADFRHVQFSLGANAAIQF